MTKLSGTKYEELYNKVLEINKECGVKIYSHVDSYGYNPEDEDIRVMAHTGDW